MADFLTNLLLPPSGDKQYASSRLKKQGFGGGIQGAGPLAFDLSQGKEDDRQAALSGMSGTMGQLIKLMTYLKGIGAFRGAAFQEVNQPPNFMPFRNHQEQRDYSQPQPYDPNAQLINQMKKSQNFY